MTTTAATAAPAATEVKVGSIFYESWGYDQTNVNFYEVVGITPSGKSVRVREVNARVVGERGGPSESVVPVPGTFSERSEVKTKRLQDGYRNAPTIKVRSFSWAWFWDGTPKHRTGSGWGH